MHFANVATCFSRTQYIAAFESKFSPAGGGVVRRGAKARVSYSGHSGGKSRTGSGAEFPGVLLPAERTAVVGVESYRVALERGAPGARRGGVRGLRDGTSGWVRGTSHPGITSLVSPTWSIVMCSKSTGGVHCWRHARAHDLLWWPTPSMFVLTAVEASSALDGRRPFWRFRANCPGPELSMVDLRGGTRIVYRLLLSLSLVTFVLRYRWARHLIVPCFTHVRASWKSPGYSAREIWQFSGRRSDVIMTRYFLVTVRIM